ncbi:MAG: hypothetical protein ACFBSG_15015 [Leptolyngbyaceae cyanobacterium]
MIKQTIVTLTSAVTIGLVSVGSAQAAIFSISDGISGGSAASLDLTEGSTENSFVVGFDELQGVSTTAPVAVDYLIDACDVGQQFTGVNNPPSGSPLELELGVYDSHLLHFDPIGGGSVSTGTFTFDGDIVAIIANQEFLNRSDAVLVNAATYEKSLGRRTEDDDLFTVTTSRSITVDFFKVSSPYIDNLRVITKAKPVSEPAALFGLGALGAIAVGGAIKMKRATPAV